MYEHITLFAAFLLLPRGNGAESWKESLKVLSTLKVQDYESETFLDT
jgi:hypothetical protein